MIKIHHDLLKPVEIVLFDGQSLLRVHRYRGTYVVLILV